MDKETLHFKIGLSGSSPIKQPHVTIKVSGQEYCNITLTKNPNETEYFEFDTELQEGNHSLEIVFLNKTDRDTVLDQNGNIMSDLLLNIDSIEIDEIDLGTLLWTASVYRPDYPKAYLENSKLKGESLPLELGNFVNLGWNGVWSLPFTSPFYIWLLENI